MRKTRTRTGAWKIGIAIFSIATCIHSTGVLAQEGSGKTWRCGNSYADRPCEGGKTVRVDDNRSTQDRQAADAATRSVRTQADQMERSRLAQEKAAYDRDQRAAREGRSAALAERRLALAEQREREHARKSAAEPRKPSASFKGAPADKLASDAPKKRKKRKSAGSDAA
ncbi:hypothetical protein [Variovorax sp. E3]|uniref:hypothetical protein n=1 Tax=Variovorax sp. E3 TaxID=1914993 RepID=UPI0018DC8D0D|nr:hypothetical protein [Variovorax sp. E3]